MRLIGWEVILIFTICLQQVLTEDYCSNNGDLDVSNIRPLKCKLGVNQRQCVNWRIPMAIYLRNADQGSEQNVLSSILGFMKQAAFYCDNNSYTQLYIPGPYAENKCPKFHSITDSIYSNITYKTAATAKLELEDVDQDSPGYILYNMLYKMKECLLQTPLSSDQGGAAFVFTDITYEQMCDDMFLANSPFQLGTLIAELISNKYSVVFQLFSRQPTEDFVKFQQLFNVCTKLNDCYLFLNAYEDDWSFDGVWFETCPRYGLEMPEGEIIYLVSLCASCVVLSLALFCAFFQKTLRKMRRSRKQINNDFCTIIKRENDKTSSPTMDIIADDWEINLTDILLKDSEVLGYGAFGTVFKAIIAEGKVPLLQKQGYAVQPLICLPDGTYEAALKRLPEHSIKRNIADLRNEIQFMKDLGYHPHVISMLGCVSVNDDPMLVLEYCEHKDLLNFLRKHRGNYMDSNMKNEEEEDFSLELFDPPSPMAENSGSSFIPIIITPKTLLSLAWQICDGMTYLVSKDIIHRDLAARNVLLNSRLVAKIGDFGMCRRSKDVFYTSKGGRLPVKWMAPESLKFFKFSSKTDVWSYGVVLYEVFSLGLTPYIAVDPEYMCDYLDEGNRLPKVDKCPEEIYEIMEKCWEADPEKRPSFNEIRQSLATFLNESDGNYNYVDLMNPPMNLSSSP
ncbi:unnamed protein product [Auanema sp. JU1783]|nr:unnamed protein product [Auanema sp. JU1783]